ncbi:glycosyltransferase [Candidatus Uhrbacteria bacterium]|nr:glycosyltransferase [Candidatus Uhrbacteria bacterium]
MKLFYIQNCRFPTEKAHGYQIAKMCEAFSVQDANLSLIVPDKNNSIKTIFFDYYHLRKNFVTEYINFFDFSNFNSWLPGRVSFYLNEVEFLLAILFKKFDKNSHCITRDPFVAFVLKLKKIAVLYECHDWFNKGKMLALLCLKKVDYIITTNKFIKQNFLNNGFHAKRVHCLPNGIDLETFNLNLNKQEARAELMDFFDVDFSSIRQSTILLYTGSYKTMGVEKGIDEILLALKKIHTKGVYFVAVGGSDKDIAYYQQVAKNIGIEEYVVLLGRVDQSTLAKFQKSADLLLMPFPDRAHYRFHMTPLKMFEYMASKRPIIASKLPSIQAILNQEAAYFVKPGDAEDLAKKIDQILNNSEEAELIADNAFKNVLQFEWKNRAKKILDIMNYGS